MTDKEILLVKLGVYMDEGYDHDILTKIDKIKRLARRHERQCVNACNGEGYVNGKFYRLDQPGAYVSGDETVFDAEIERLEGKITSLVGHVFSGKDANANGGPRCEGYNLAVRFQHDPRGWTVRLWYRGLEVSGLMY